MKRTVYKEIASAIYALRRSEARSVDDCDDLIDRHRERAEQLTASFLPYGSGFDDGTHLDLDESKPNKLVFLTHFHHMDNGGMYDGWTDHVVTVRPSLIFDLEITVSGSNRNDIKDYIAETFDSALREIFEE